MQKLQILRILTTQFLTEGYPQVGRQREAYASWFLHRILRAGSRKPIEQIQKSNCANNKIIFATHVRTITNEQNGRMKPHKTTGKTTTRYEDTISKESKKAKKNNWTPPNGWSRHLLLPRNQAKPNPTRPIFTEISDRSAVVLTARRTLLAVVNNSLALHSLDAKALVKWVVACKVAVANQSARDMRAGFVRNLFETTHFCFVWS